MSMNNISLDSEQLRILDWRAAGKDVAAVIGPPGCGKTTVGSGLGIKLIAEGLAKRVLLVSYTNAAANEFGWELYNILGNTAQKFCVRTGNPTGIDPALDKLIPFKRHINDILDKKIVICTTLSLKILTKNMRFDNIVVDEAGINRIEHILWPFSLGVDPMARYKWHNNKGNYENNQNDQINDLMDLIVKSGAVATVIGDPKQSRPISPDRRDYSAIEWVIKRTRSDTLRLSHRLPDQLSGLVNDFAKYDGLRSAPEVASRRLILDIQPDTEYKDIIQPSVVTTWVDIKKANEEPIGPSSWANEVEARACARICRQLSHLAPHKSVVVITRYTAQKQLIRSYLQSMGLNNIKVTTTTGALGTQADIVLFSLVRNNPENNVGAAGTLQDVNVAISRAKEKLIILGNFDMMLSGWTSSPSNSQRGYKSPTRDLAHLVDRKYGKVIDAPQILN